MHSPDAIPPEHAQPRRCRFTRLLAYAVAALVSAAALPARAQTEIPLNVSEAFSTYYLTVQVGGGPVEDYLVDTGAGLMTITDATRAHLENAGQARLLRHIEGHMADGRVLRVPIYHIDEIVIGGSCVLRDVEAAVLAGASRGLLGLSVLKRTSPFEFSVDPPALKLSNCFERPVLAASVGSAR